MALSLSQLKFTPGFRLVPGEWLQTMLNAINGTTPAPATVTTITASSTVTLSPANANVVLSPTGTGVVTIDPATAGAVDNVVIGGVTPAAITGTSVTATGNAGAAYFDSSAATGLSAAGTTRTDALALTHALNNVTTVAASTGVILPASATVGVGGQVVIYNNGASVLKVYAAGSDTIDGTAGSTGVSLTNALRCEYRVIASGAFLSAKLGATST